MAVHGSKKVNPGARIKQVAVIKVLNLVPSMKEVLNKSQLPLKLKLQIPRTVKGMSFCLRRPVSASHADVLSLRFISYVSLVHHLRSKYF